LLHFCSPVSPYAKSTGHSQKFLVFLLPASQVLGKRTNTAKSSCQKASPMKQIGQSPGWCKQRAYPAEDCQHKKSNIQLIDSISSSEQSVKHGSHHFFASLLRIWPFFWFPVFSKDQQPRQLTLY
ncbi:MAG: hypothetical protein ACLS43_06855, partial [Evtepia gabavorous]